MKALVVRLSSIGDVVHTLPCLDALHRAGHSAGWLAEAPSRDLLAGHPLLTCRVEPPRSRAFRFGPARDAVAALRREHFDIALDFQGLWKSAAWARLSGARRVRGYAGRFRREPASACLIGERFDQPDDAVHVIDKNLALLRGIGIDAVGSREFSLPTTSSAAERVARGLSELRVERFALLNPAGGWKSKLWPPECYGRLARGLQERGVASVVSWGPGEQALAGEVVDASGGVARLSFPTTLSEFAELARRAALIVAADTGPLHIACAVGAPAVGLYGPTDPARNGPFSVEDEVVRRAPPCAPCHKRSCAVHANIMSQIPGDEVLAAAERRLGRGMPHAV